MHVRAELTSQTGIHRCLNCNVARTRERGAIGDQTSLTVSNVILLIVSMPSFDSEVDAVGGDRGRRARNHVYIVDLMIELGLWRMYEQASVSEHPRPSSFCNSSAPDVVCLASMMSVALQVRRDPRQDMQGLGGARVARSTRLALIRKSVERG
jgi:hypothetical protein